MANIVNVSNIANYLSFEYSDGSVCCITPVKGDSIEGVTKISGDNPTSGSIDTYRIDMSNGNNTCFSIRNGKDLQICESTNNANGTVTFNFSDGTCHTTANLKGDKGESICNVALKCTVDNVDTYQISTTDNNNYSFDVKHGRSMCMSSITPNVDNTYTWNFSDGTSYKTGILKGDKGVGVKCLQTLQSATAAGGVSIYRLLFTDNTSSSDICVHNGNGIKCICRTVGNGALGSLDTYTITLGDSSTTTFNVQNGNGISCIARAASDVGVPADTDRYIITLNTGATSYFDVAQGTGITCVIKHSTAQPGGYDVYKMCMSKGCAPSYFCVYRPIDGARVVEHGLVCCYYEQGVSRLSRLYKSTFQDGSSTCYSVMDGTDGARITSITQSCFCINPITSQKIDAVYFNFTAGNCYWCSKVLLCHGMPSTITCIENVCSACGILRMTFNDGFIYCTPPLKGTYINYACTTYYGEFSTINFRGSDGNWIPSDAIILNGKSAYAYACAAGYTGTENEFSVALLKVNEIENQLTAANNLAISIDNKYTQFIATSNEINCCVIPCINKSLSCSLELQQSTICVANDASWYASGSGVRVGNYSAKCYMLQAKAYQECASTAVNTSINCITVLTETFSNCMTNSYADLTNCKDVLNTELVNTTTTMCNCIGGYVACSIAALTCGAGTACMWAETPLNVIICNDGTKDRYSALHWACCAEMDATTTSCDRLSVSADKACIAEMYNCVSSISCDVASMYATIGNSVTCVNAACYDMMNGLNTFYDCVCTLTDNINTAISVSNCASTVIDLWNDNNTNLAALAQCVQNNTTCTVDARTDMLTKLCNTTVKLVGSLFVLHNGANDLTSCIDLKLNSTLAELSDVCATNEYNNNDVLAFCNDKWVNKELIIDWNVDSAEVGTPRIINKPFTGFKSRRCDFRNVNCVLINHNLGYNPSVDVYTTGGQLMFTSVFQLTLNDFRVEFSNYESGYIIYK